MPLPATQTLPGLYSVSQFFDTQGHLYKNTDVLVAIAGTFTEAALYNADGSAAANPTDHAVVLAPGITGGIDNDGNLQFYAAEGWYDLYAGTTYIGTVNVTATAADLLHRNGAETKHGTLDLRDGLAIGSGSTAPDVTLLHAPPSRALAAGQLGVYVDAGTGSACHLLRSGGAVGDGNNSFFGFVLDPTLNNWGMTDSQAQDIAIVADNATSHVRIQAGTSWAAGIPSQLSIGTDGITGTVPFITTAAAGTAGYRARVTGDTFDRSQLLTTGLWFGPGNAAVDIGLVRSALPTTSQIGVFAEFSTAAIFVPLNGGMWSGVSGAADAIGMSVAAAGYFSDSLAGDMVVRASGGKVLRLGVNGSPSTVQLTPTAVTLTDAVNLGVGSTTGTKIGTATTQKLGFFGATPVVQPTAAGGLLAALVSLGLIGSGTTPLTLSGLLTANGGATFRQNGANTIVNIDNDNTAGHQSNLTFEDGGTAKWALYHPQNDPSLHLYDWTNTRNIIDFNSAAVGALVLGVHGQATIDAQLNLSGTPPIKLPTGTAGYVLQSDATGALTLGAPPAGTPHQWTENDQLTSGAVTIPMANGGVQQVTLNGNVTGCTVTGAAKGMIMVLRIVQDATGGRTWTWFTNVVWSNGQPAPSLGTGANATATFTFEYDGTNWIEKSRTPFDSGWINATYQAAGVGTAAGQGAVAYRKIGSVVYLRGVLGQNSGGPMVLNNGATPLFTLPAGFFQTDADAHHIVATSAASPVGYLWVNHSTGGVIPAVGPSAAGSWWAMRFSFALT